MSTSSIRRLVSTVCLVLALASRASAQGPSVLHEFPGADTAVALGGLTAGADGLLYGTTSGGGVGGGTVFRIATDGSGFEVLHTFGDGSVADDGLNPGYGALLQDAAGLFYGTTIQGGAYGEGTLFQLDARGAAPSLVILHSFDGPLANPESGVIVGSDGFLYGTTGTGATTNGTIYRIAPDGSNLQTLHTFDYQNGSSPRGTLIEGSDGVLYGTTRLGGATGAGTVFRIERDGTAFATLADLDGYAQVGVTEAPGPDGTPHLFGVEHSGTDPAHALGAIFRLRPDGTEFTRLSQFYGGAHPQSPLLLGRDGGLYGTAFDSNAGCIPINCGVVFRVGEIDSRPWTIHQFTRTNGGGPSGALVQGPDGALYGVTANGGTIASTGASGAGVIFRVPNAASTPLVFTGPPSVTEGGFVTYALALDNTTGVPQLSNNISLTFPDGLVFDHQSSDAWFCSTSAFNGVTALCQWNTLLQPGETTDVHTLTFTVAPPYAAQCGLSPSPCIQSEAVLQYSGARVVVTTPVATYVNGFLNRPPQAQDDAAGVSGTVPTRIRVLANDVDPDGDSLSVSAIAVPPSRGTAVVNADGTVTYTATVPLVGNDTFWYRLDDGRGATATARVVLSPLAASPLSPLADVVDLGAVAIGELAAGRTWVLSPVPLTGTVTFEALSPPEIATALAGTGHDASRATSDPNAFRGSSWLSLLTPPYDYAGQLTLYHRGTGQPGDVSVARAVITADGAGANPPTTTVIVVATAVAPTLAPRRARADVATASPSGTPITIDVLANDVVQLPTSAHYIQMVSSCANLGAFLFDGAPCSGGLGHIEFPGMTDPAQVITFTPDAGAPTAPSGFSYGFSELEACASAAVCLPVNPIYFAPVSVTSQAGAPVDLELTLTLAPSVVDAGQAITGTATITNLGTGTATGVILRGLAALTSFQNLTLVPSRGQCQAIWTAGSPVACTLGAIDPGQTVTIAIGATAHEGLLLSGQQSRSLFVSADVAGTEPDARFADNTASTVVTVNTALRPHLAITALQFESLAGALLASAQVGDVVRYRVTLQNTTTVPATFSVSTTLPAGLAFVPGLNNWPCTVTGNVVTCTGAAAASENVSDVFAVSIGNGALAVGQTGAVVTVPTNLSVPGDTNQAGHAGLVTLSIQPRPLQAELSVQVSASPSNANVGQPITLSLTVFNSGPDAASNVRLSAFNFLAGVDFTGSTFPSNWTCAPLVNGQPLSCQVAQLAPGTSTVFAVTAAATTGVFTGGSGAATLTIDASVAADEPDAQTQNNVGSALVSIARPPAVMSINATVSPNPVAVGDTVTYQIDIVNTGVTDATGVGVVIDLPADIGVVSLDRMPSLSQCGFSPALSQGGTPDVTITCSLSPLPVNRTHVLSLTGRLLGASQGGAVSFPVVVSGNNCVDASPLPGTQCAVANVQTAQLVTTMQAEILITDPVPPATAVVGSAVTLVARVTNTGAAPARQTRVTLQFPTELANTQTLSLFGPLTGCSFRPNLTAPGVFMDCTLGTLAPGEIKEARFVTQVAAVPLAPAAPIVMRVGSVDCIDLSTAGGSQCDSVAVGPIITRATLTATLTGAKSDGSPIQLGDLVNVTGRVTNSNTTTARNVVARFILPTSLGLSQLTAQPPLSGCSFSPSLSNGALGTPGVTMTCSLSSLAPGASATWAFTVRPLAIPATGDYQPRLEFGSTDCRDLSGGGNLCDAVTGSIPVTPSPTGSAGGGTVSLSLSGGTFGTLQSLPTTALPQAPPGVTFPYGAMAFEVYDVPVGGTIAIAITTPAPVTGYWKLSASVWSQFPGAVSNGSGGLVLTLTDGGFGDADGVANGVIVDPGALGVSVSSPPQADAGVDVVAEATGSNGAAVTLAGTGSDPAGSPLTFAWSGVCGAASSAVATFSCPPGTSTMTLTVSNSAGLTASDTVQVTVRDTTPPTATLTLPADGAVYVLNQTVSAAYQCADSGLGVSSCAGTVPNGSPVDTSSIGTKTFQVTAVDAAGHQVSVTHSYRVIFAASGACYLDDGHAILPPIATDGSTVVPRGEPVLARFRVCDDARVPVGPRPVVSDFRMVQRITRDGTRTMNEDVPALLSAPGFQWNPVLKTWYFVIDTRRLPGKSVYVFRITLTDGSTIPFRFAVR